MNTRFYSKILCFFVFVGAFVTLISYVIGLCSYDLRSGNRFYKVTMDFQASGVNMVLKVRDGFFDIEGASIKTLLPIKTSYFIHIDKESKLVCFKTDLGGERFYRCLPDRVRSEVAPEKEIDWRKVKFKKW